MVKSLDDKECEHGLRYKHNTLYGFDEKNNSLSRINLSTLILSASGIPARKHEQVMSVGISLTLETTLTIAWRQPKKYSSLE
ncbi:hypothetical protein PPTG_24100 [Phytophthora nicotianae INRA-310]|uniref:Uncharacterized protein n=1 Tax=Phytophthora nicotianae (strain INRA-310) TaxID=761204 RepID=W2PM73_PHYN3|nr:hypothetical protein PPTG_24100 [Phytophthora nicotianae INRA-310]ETN01334.1 hypothetical protein PPTG_24100 [Phytophthora nicotianae INRA-310]